MSGKKVEFEIDLVSLKEGDPREYDFHIGKDFFESKENSDVLGADVDVHLTVTRHHDTYDLEFECDGEMAMPCDRCLDPVKHEVGVDYDIRVRYGEEYDDSSDEVLVIPESRTRLDVSGLIYDTLLLTVPLRCVHADGECNRDMAEVLRQHEGGVISEESETE